MSGFAQYHGTAYDHFARDYARLVSAQLYVPALHNANLTHNLYAIGNPNSPHLNAFASLGDGNEILASPYGNQPPRAATGVPMNRRARF